MGTLLERSMTMPATPPSSPYFKFSPPPAFHTLDFPLPVRNVTSRKRFRSITDVDGEFSSESFKKKRRLRLLLITSRLSRPFSQPASNCVDRGRSKIAVWAKQKALGRNLLRKAAILNHIKRTQKQSSSDLLETKDGKEIFRQAFLYGAPDTMTHPVINTSGPATIVSPNIVSPNLVTPPAALVRGPNVNRHVSDESIARVSPLPQIPRRDYVPLPPSPLGPSNYDALDVEDQYSEAENDAFGGCAVEDEDDSSYYSDWSVFEAGDADDTTSVTTDDRDHIEAFASPETIVLLRSASEDQAAREERETRRREELVAEMRREKARQREMLFARFH